jgi:hypothetical protein
LNESHHGAGTKRKHTDLNYEENKNDEPCLVEVMISPHKSPLPLFNANKDNINHNTDNNHDENTNKNPPNNNNNSVSLLIPDPNSPVHHSDISTNHEVNTVYHNTATNTNNYYTADQVNTVYNAFKGLMEATMTQLLPVLLNTTK